MIIPSIDIMCGRVVQLIQGEELALTSGDPFDMLDAFSIVGEVAVIDLDRARNEGDNSDLIREMCARRPVRVGGGIRDVEDAVDWLDGGARKVIIGTAASPELLLQLPKERVIVALDYREGEVLSHGWRESTGETVAARLEKLTGLCAGFLITSVEREGGLGGVDLDQARQLVTAAGDARVTIAGGVASAEEVAALDRLGADAQVGMALYTGRLGLPEALAASLDPPDGLWPTVVVDEHGVALGLAWSDRESICKAVESRTGVYHSRSRGLWVKGATSGATQELISVDLDCDRDTLRFTVRQADPGFCHLETRTCWGSDHGLSSLDRRLTQIAAERPEDSNTVRLLEDADLLKAKLIEEATELSVAPTEEVAAETADLLYFALTKAKSAGVTLEDIVSELDRRSLRVSRRPMRAEQ